MPAHLLQVAKKLANDAGRMALDYQKKGFTVSHKSSAIDLVTEADKAVNDFIIKTVESHFPDHSLLTEESGAINKDGEYKWIVDPIDGTTNFARGLPWYCVSIAVIHKGKPIIGVVEIPALKESFWAQQGKGAHLNNNVIHVSKKARLEECLFATGFPYARGPRYELNVKLFDAFYRPSLGVRRLGSAAIDLAFVAAGRFDGFWEYDLEAWDVAAAKIIVEEAGGTVTNMDGSTFNPKLKNVLASNSALHGQMLQMLKQHGADCA